MTLPSFDWESKIRAWTGECDVFADGVAILLWHEFYIVCTVTALQYWRCASNAWTLCMNVINSQYIDMPSCWFFCFLPGGKDWDLLPLPPLGRLPPRPLPLPPLRPLPPPYTNVQNVCAHRQIHLGTIWVQPSVHRSGFIADEPWPA